MNTTLTSPTVYMQFKNVFAIGTDYVAMSSFQNTLLPLAPTAVSSRCGLVGGGFGPPQSMNYADLNQPVPASAYRCQPKCFTNDQLPEDWQTPYTKYATENRCSTIWNDYNPALSVPTEFATVFPSAGFINSDLPGLACTFILDPDGGNIFFDPPSALTQAQTAAGPSIPAGGAGQTTTDHQTHHTLPVVALSSTTQAQGPSVPTVSAEPARLSTISGTDHAISITQFSLFIGDCSRPGSRVIGEYNRPSLPPCAAGLVVSKRPATRAGSADGSSFVQFSVASVGGVIVSYIVPAAIPAPASTTSAGIGGIIASVLGVTRSTASNPAVAASSIDPRYPAAQKPAPGSADPGSQTSSPVAPQAIPDSFAPGTQPANAPAPQTATVGGQTFTVKPAANGPSAVVVANGAKTATLAPGATTVIGNQHISAPSSGGVVVGSGSGAATLAPAAAPADPAASSAARLPVITVGSAVVTPDHTASQYVVGSQTLAPGSSAIVVSGTTYSLAPSATALVANGVTQVLPSASPASSGPSFFTAGGQTLSRDSSSNVVVAGQTLHPGSQTVIAGTTYSLAPSATALAVNGVTQSLHSGSSASAPQPYFTAGGQTLTQDSSSNLIIAGQTLHPGSQTVVAGTTYSLAPSGSALVVNGVTQAPHSLTAPTARAGIFTINSQTLTENASSNLLLPGGQTLHPSSSATVISGTTYSLAPSGSALVVNGATQTLRPAAGPATSALAGISAASGSSVGGSSALSSSKSSAALGRGSYLRGEGVAVAFAAVMGMLVWAF
ncbi:hypothetical protein B0A54_08501 [Friedmanniomyces endolithicus]|uniref:Uncharacterized protein n=1 Tax=Friedmanniomyces endolithicus TaxID=329885 RepID=A0A4U0UUD8_9PEZI|nr:hypothetical protein B0A54_08501 [Friedmanniomyces endolithicus]